MLINVKKLHPDATLPTYGTAGAACFDLSVASINDVGINKSVYGTGLSFEIPKDHVMLVFSRSGHGFKDDIRLSNCVGVIDSDYRGEVKVKLRGDSATWPHFNQGDRIAQAMILPIQQVSFALVDELSDTDRGVGGFGSTGDATIKGD